MEKMPYGDGPDRCEPRLPGPRAACDHERLGAGCDELSRPDWRTALPELNGTLATLRELRVADAPSLLTMLTSEEVVQFVPPLPNRVEGFERFILSAQTQRMSGSYACFGVVPKNSDTVAGLFQLRQLEPGFANAEWGFAMAREYWGTGIFLEGAKLVADFAFDDVGVHRLEARVCSRNARGSAAMRKLGATQEGVLRQSFLRDGEYLDRVLWSILREDWYRAKAVWGPKMH